MHTVSMYVEEHVLYLSGFCFQYMQNSSGVSWGWGADGFLGFFFYPPYPVQYCEDCPATGDPC